MTSADQETPVRRDPGPDPASTGTVTDPVQAHDLRIAIIRLARRIRAERSDTALTDSQLSVIGTLAHDTLTLTELSERERVTPPSMNRTVNSLVAAGYVDRNPSADDGRKVHLVLTERGRKIAAETRSRREAWFVRTLENLTAEQHRLLFAAAPVLRELAKQ